MAPSTEYGFVDGRLPEGFAFASDGAVECDDARLPASIVSELARDGALVGAKVA